MPKIKVDIDKCTGCGTYVDLCPSGVYQLDNAAGKTKVVAEDESIECLACQDQCPENAIEVETN
ncbi:MAG: ferredoxin family protein [Candidatus Helarchaeota archaeon]|nr:ferredoxin family protein [Candidatus Helarchaeota archaeon]